MEEGDSKSGGGGKEVLWRWKGMVETGKEEWRRGKARVVEGVRRGSGGGKEWWGWEYRYMMTETTHIHVVASNSLATLPD